MKIYLIYVWDKKLKENTVTTAFTSEKAAKNYVNYWNSMTEDNMYFYKETDLDRFAKIYENEEFC